MRFLALICLFAVGGIDIMTGQSAAPTVTITKIASYVRIVIRIANEQPDSIAIPDCGVGEDRILCTRKMYLEQRMADRWVRVSAHLGLILGDVPASRFATIQPKHHAEFVLEFVPAMFDIEPSKPLRVVVIASNNEDAVRAGRNQVLIATPTFRLP